FEDYYQRFPFHTKLLVDVFREAKGSVRPNLEEAHSSCPTVSTQSASEQKKDADQQEPAPPARLGRYCITGTLGKGGFGVVYKGYDDELQREVAIKVPHRHIETYLTEGQILAKLDHPHIVPVFDVGTDHGKCFIVSKFIEGSDLATRIKESRL